ncbi:MAG: PD-(D/E)XK nuclease family protein, partial [bacterium]
MDLNKNKNININNNNKLNYFFGNAGTGKFYNCTNSILNRQDNNLKSVLIIPEQFTMQAEKQLIDNSKNNIIFNTQVLNFKRLAHRIFEEMGIPKEKPLEDIGQVMVIRKILYTLDTQNNLYYFSENSYNNIGLLEKLVAILKEFFQFEVSVNMLVDAINSLKGIADVSESVDDKIQEKINDNIINNINIQDIDNSSSGNINQNLILKLTDLKNIYSLYKEYLEKEYITDDSILELLLKTIDHSNIIDSQTHVFVYGFEEFNSQELNILYKLFEKSQQVNIYFTLNTSETYYNDIDIFDPYSCIKQTINKIQDQILTPLAISVSSTYLDTNFRHKNNPELKHLEENFFKYKPSTYNSIPQNIKITSARNKYIEIENVAQQIFNLVKNEDYKFGDMTIILGDNSYANPLKMIFNKYNIPYFLDDKKPIINHSLVELIISSLEIILYNFQYEHIFRYLKSSYFDTLKINGLTKENINLLENYALKYQIKGFRWQQDFTYGSNSEFINSLRKSFLLTMSKLDIKKTKKYTSLEICTKIIDFIIDIKVKETIDIIIKREEDLFDKNIIKNTGNLDEHIQVFNSIGEILQKFVDIMGEDELTLEEFLKILKSGFEKETISIIPPKQDQILIGNFDRTKITNNKVIFLLAMNNGFVPAYKEESPFISDLEKVILRNNGIEMRNSSTTMLVTDMLKIYSLMLKPLDKIYLSYAISNLDGGVKNPSMVIDKVKDIFPKLKDKEVEQENKIDFIKLDLYSTHEIIFDNLFKNFDLFNTIKENLELQDVLKWFLDDDVDDNIDYEYGQKLTQIKESIEKLESNNDNFITKENLEYMYNNNKLFSSVSKLEEFNKCPFSYFLKYNINLRERDVDLLNNLKLGNLYHEILEKFSIEVFNNTSEFDDWKVLNKKDIYDKLDKIVNDMYKTDNINNILKSSPKYNYFFNRIKKITAISVEALIKQLKYGEFKPTDFEVNFEDIEEN